LAGPLEAGTQEAEVSSLTLDAGALIAVDCGDRTMLAIVRRAQERGEILTIPAGVVGQVWRNGTKQARLARLLVLDEVEIEALDEDRARAAGQLCGVTKTSDVIDASVVLGAKERGHAVVTSDPDELLRLDPKLTIIRV
jgi:hypothetical protein